MRNPAEGKRGLELENSSHGNTLQILFHRAEVSRSLPASVGGSPLYVLTG